MDEGGTERLPWDILHSIEHLKCLLSFANHGQRVGHFPPCWQGGQKAMSDLSMGRHALSVATMSYYSACERFHRTVKEEFYAVAFRKTFYKAFGQSQRDLDRYLAFYNCERAHQGYHTQGRTLYHAFTDGIEPLRREEVKPEAAFAKIDCHWSSPVSAHLQPNTSLDT